MIDKFAFVMNTKHNILVFLLQVLLIASCKKNAEEKPVYMDGIAVDVITNQPIPGLKIYAVTGGIKLYHDLGEWNYYAADTVTTSTYSINYLSIDSTVTDANGRFSIKYTPVSVPLEGIATPYLILGESPRIRVTKNVFGFSNDRNIDTLFTELKSVLKIDVKKLSPAFPNDTVFQHLNYWSQNYNPIKQYHTKDNLKCQVGRSKSTITNVFSYYHYKTVEVEWRYYRNGLQSFKKDTIILMPHDTTYFNINY